LDELTRDLLTLGRQLDYPPTPDLAARVDARLRSLPAEPPFRGWGWRVGRLPRAIAVALVALLVLAGTVVAASPTARHAILDIFGLRGARIERTTAPPPPTTPRKLNVGKRLSLAQASKLLEFHPLIPAAVGRPDAVRLNPLIRGGGVSLMYRPGPGLPRTETTGLGLLISEFRGDLNPEYLTKIVPQATRVKRLRILGDRAAWIAGAPHYFFYRAPGGGFGEAPLEVAQNVLLLERGRLLVRVEGAFSLPRAREIARSLR
jgi:hypothetical protein